MSSEDLIFHMIGNAHLDPAWMWQWPEGMQAFRATARAALERMNETEEFVFTCSQPAAYRWIEKTEPELFDKIRVKVQEGRWCIVGGWWVQPDCNLPGGEGFVRQGLLGQRYYLEKFGRIARTGYCVDSFGHTGSLPQILLKSGLRNYVFTRPGADDLELPESIFWWQAADGSRVLAYRIPYHYNNYDHDVAEKIDGLSQDLQGRESAPREWMLFYGVGDHGGGPTKANIATILERAARPGGPRPVFSHPERYFAGLRESAYEFPVHRDDLQIHAPGCYSAHSRIKQLNRQAESWLMTAEKWSSIAHQVIGATYPAAELRAAWEQVCFNHFHDILCGTSIHEACEDAVQEYGAAISTAREYAHLGMQRLAAHVDTSVVGGSREVQALIVFNPNSWAVEGTVRFEFWYDIHKSLWDRPVHLRVLGIDGEELPCQLVYSSGKIGKDRIGVLVPVEVPSLGYSTYIIRYGEKSSHVDEHPIVHSDFTLENDTLGLEIDPLTGWILRLFDKRHDIEVLSGPGARPVVMHDPTDTWGHGSGIWDEVVGVFTDAECRVVEEGPLRTSVRVRSFYNESWVEQEFRLYRNRAELEVQVTVSWSEQRKMLKLQFPVNVQDPVTTFEIPYGVISKPCDGRERPGQGWFDLSGAAPAAHGPERRGLCIANDAKYSYSAKASSMFLTVLRSPIFAYHEPHPLSAEQELRFQDQGQQRFTYIVRPHGGDWRQGRGPRLAQELNAPLFAQLESGHPGTLDKRLSGLQVGAASVSVSVLKQAEDGDAYIVRCYETEGINQEVEFQLPLIGRTWKATLGAHEIKSFRVPLDHDEAVSETSLIEIELA